MSAAFKLTPQYSRIVNYCLELGILDQLATFQCFADSIFNYSIKDEKTMVIFEFCADDSLIPQMEVSWLLDLKRVTYFHCSIFEIEEDEWVEIHSELFSHYSDEMLN